jgi:hypothetical protein
MSDMQVLAALFIDTIDLRQVDGPSTRIDLGGVKFSEVPAGGYPASIEPHLVVLVRNPPDASPDGVLEVTYWIDDEQVARNVQPLQVEPGKFNYRLVRAELTVEAPATIEARVRIGQGEATVVPFALLPTA